MELNSLLLIFFLLVLVIGYLAIPFFQRTSPGFVNRNIERSHLLAERERILNLLTDLDLDFEMGKFTETRYKQERQNLLLQGAKYLKELEDMESSAGDYQKDLDIDSDDPIENIINERKEAYGAKGLQSCNNCGHKIHKGDRFCVNCGKPVK